MRYLLSIVCALTINLQAFSQPDVEVAKAKAAAALKLAQSARPGAHCQKAIEAKAKAALTLAEVARERTECLTDYALAMERASKADKILFLWSA